MTEPERLSARSRFKLLSEPSGMPVTLGRWTAASPTPTRSLGGCRDWNTQRRLPSNDEPYARLGAAGDRLDRRGTAPAHRRNCHHAGNLGVCRPRDPGRYRCSHGIDGDHRHPRLSHDHRCRRAWCSPWREPRVRAWSVVRPPNRALVARPPAPGWEVGMSAMRYRRFIAWTAPACLIWAGSYVSIAWFAASRYKELSKELSWAIYLFFGVIVIFVIVVWLIKKQLLKSEKKHMTTES